jgi:nitrite reductase/ring-hydroxylating ferredoxin subunit
VAARQIRICRVDEVPAATGMGFSIAATGPGPGLDVLIVRRGGQCFVYENRCPHRGLNLDWHPGRFLDPDGAFIQCANHDARFRIEDGQCVAGPCAGARLRALATTIDGDGYVVIGPVT